MYLSIYNSTILHVYIHVCISLSLYIYIYIYIYTQILAYMSAIVAARHGVCGAREVALAGRHGLTHIHI